MVYGPGFRRTVIGLGLAVVGTGAITATGLAGNFAPAAVRPGFALVILFASLIGGLWPGLLAALAGFGSYVFFLVRPAAMLDFRAEEILVLIAFAAVAVVVAALSSAAAAARQGRQRLAFLAETNALLSSSLDFRTTLGQVVRLAVPTLGDWCAIELPGEAGRGPEVQVAHANPGRLEQARELMRRYPPDYTDDNPVVQVMASGKPLLLSTIPDELLRRAARDEEHLRALQELGLRSALVVPLRARGRVFGALTLVQAESGRRYRATDLAVAEELAKSAATALDNARLYRERSEVARTLSQSLLPAHLPEIPGVELAARFRPAGEGNLVGGDFYDVFETGEGEWVMVIGDVCGKGPEAAALTGLVRHTVRAVSVRERRPSAVLNLVNRQIKLEDTDRFCTIAFARLQHNGDGRISLTVASGGHPPPLLLRARRSVEATDSRGQLLGVLDRPELIDRPVELEGGDVVLFYTDGVTEPFDRAGVPAEARIVSVLWSCADEDATGIATRIEREVLEFTEGPPRDDVAIMVLRVTTS